MPVAPIDRAHHIKQTIQVLKSSLAGRTFESLLNDRLDWAGYERLLLIISEAARHLPEEWKRDFGPDLKWRPIADLANQLRHVYHATNPAILWSIYTNDLDPLEAAIDRMIAAHGG